MSDDEPHSSSAFANLKVMSSSLPRVNLRSAEVKQEERRKEDDESMSSLEVRNSSSYERFKSEFYTEITERLKRLVEHHDHHHGSISSTQSQAAPIVNDDNSGVVNKSSMSSIDLFDIPFIDDDESAVIPSSIIEDANNASIGLLVSSSLSHPIVVSSSASNSSSSSSSSSSGDNLNHHSAASQLKIDCNQSNASSCLTASSELIFDSMSTICSN